MMTILVTGGAGYIGSHTCIELLEAGYQVVVVDNLCNSSKKSLERVQEITGKELTFYQDDLLDSEALDAIFQRESIDAVIHFAGLKAVGESVQKPLEYYHNNLTGTFILLEKMKKYQVKNFVFSSSATVYGSPKSVPIREDFPLHVTNPYGRTKLILEEVLTDVHTADPAFNVILLRYFNPIGAHRSGRIGENPKGIPNNLLPYVAQVAMGANPAQTIKAITEAEAYHGPSLIIGYSPCEMHSIKKGGMQNCQAEMKKAVECGYWNLFRFNPEAAAGKKFSLDSKEPAGGYQEFLMNEARYASLTRSFPERAEELFKENEQAAMDRYQHLLKLKTVYNEA